MIDVLCATTDAGWTCAVSVDAGGGSATTHEVAVSRDDLVRLAPGDADPEDLVRRSFEFLLERESKESILRQFDLPLIGRYVPEYERTIRG